MDEIINQQPEEEIVPEEQNTTVSGVRKVVAYVIKDKVFEDFEVFRSSNAWWMDRGKVEALIQAFKMRHMVRTAIVYAGISSDQYKYFCKLHPDFYTVKERCEENKTLRAMSIYEGAWENNPRFALEYLKGVHPDYSTKVKVENDKPLAPSVNIAISSDVDTAKIAEILAQSARVFLTNGGAESSDDQSGGPSVEEGNQGEGA